MYYTASRGSLQGVFAKKALSVSLSLASSPKGGGLGIPQSFASSPEAPLLGELAGASPTERLDEGRPDREALAGLNLSVIASQCHLPYRGEALAYRKASPLRQRLPY